MKMTSTYEMAKERFVQLYWDRNPNIMGVGINADGVYVMLKEPEPENSYLPDEILRVPVTYNVVGEIRAL